MAVDVPKVGPERFRAPAAFGIRKLSVWDGRAPRVVGRLHSAPRRMASMAAIAEKLRPTKEERSLLPGRLKCPKGKLDMQAFTCI